MMSPDDMLAFLRARQAEAVGADPSLEELHAGMEQSGKALPVPEAMAVNEIELGGVPGLHFKPETRTHAGHLMYFHGGGYCIGSAQTHRGLVARIADLLGVEAWSMDYRLGPSHPFPAATEDGISAYTSLREKLGPDVPIGLGGDSAGGGLAVATAFQIRDAGLAKPAGLVLFSPWGDLTCSGVSHQAKAEDDPMVRTDMLKQMAVDYLGGADAAAPLASPCFADFRDFPDMLIQVGSEEVLFSDSLTLAERAGLAEVSVDLEIRPKMAHVFQFFFPLLAEADAALKRTADWLSPRMDAL